MKNKAEIIFLTVLILVSGFLRFYQLGYSHYYGDETKTLYLRKDVSAFNFLMNQRKGPMQFIVVWVTEKVSGGFSEGVIRAPFALAGTVLVLVFYIFVRQNFGFRVAMFSTLLFSLNGFYIAFSRTAQYQVLYLLFGFLALIFSKHSYFVSGSFFALALLSHYDALFFIIPLFFLVQKRGFIKILFTGIAVSLLFYLPNIALGYFGTNTFWYIARRLAGEEYLKNNSLYTAFVYNPLYIYLIILFSVSILGYIKSREFKYAYFLSVWLLVPFVTFQLMVLNPGTHIHNYYLPLFIFGGLGLDYLSKKLGRFRWVGLAVFATSSLTILLIQMWTFIPGINNGYPWKETDFVGIKVDRASPDYHLYLYGFPYYRGWDKLKEYGGLKNGMRNFYTNDNETVAEYYLYGVPYSAPGIGFFPQYYIEVFTPQALRQKLLIDLTNYKEVDAGVFPEIRIYKKNAYEKK